METPPQQKPKDNKDDATREKMEKRVKNLFVEQDPPSYVSIREVDAMKARISELEKERAGRQKEDEQVFLPSENDAVVAAESAQPAQSSRPALLLPKTFTITDEPDVNSGRPKRIALWLVGICTAIDLVFLGYLIYLVIAVHQGQFDPATKILMPVSLMALITNFVAYRLIRRDRLSLGIGVLFFMGVLLPSISAVFVFQGFGYIAASYISLMTFIIVSLVLPKNSRRWVIIAAAVSILLSIGIEYGDPYFRVDSSVEKLSEFASILIGIAVLGLIVFVVRQTASSIKAKLVIAFALLAVLSMGVVAFTSLRSLSNNLTADIVDSQEFLANSQGFQIGQELIGQYHQLRGLAALKTIQVGVDTANQENTYPEDPAQIEQLDLAWKAMVADKSVPDPLELQVILHPLGSEIRNFQKTFPENTEILLTDQKGFTVVSTYAPDDFYHGDSRWWQTVQTAGQYISQPTFDPATNSLTLDMAMPIYSFRNGEFSGVLHATVDINLVKDLLIESLHGQTGYSIIYLSNGQEIKLQSLGDGNYEIFQGFASSDLQEFAKSPNTSMEFSLDGNPVLASSAPVRPYANTLAGDGANALNDLNWKIVAVQGRSEVLQPVEVETRNNLILVIIASIIAAVSAYFLAGFIANPIIHLNDFALQIASGDLTAEAKVETRDEIGALAATFNNMTSQLRSLFGSLEQRVLDRTHDLELASEIGRTVTGKVSNVDDMLSEAVELIRSRFGLYYTQVYLLDSSSHTLTLRAGTGDVGSQLLQRGHHLLVNLVSLNGRAVSEKKPIIVADTSKNPNFLPNPLLPNTRSEMVVPLIVSGQVLGVLDMQSENPDTLNTSNLPAFEILAGQLSIAIQNAILFTQSEEARKQIEEHVRQITTTDWQDFLNAIERGEKIGFTFNQSSILPLQPNDVTSPTAGMFSAPLTVTGTEIGTIQLAEEPDRIWSKDEIELVHSTADQLAQHIENLRILAQAEKYRKEAELALRRVTREGWSSYLKTRGEQKSGFQFDLTKVEPLPDNANGNSKHTMKYRLQVRDETIGELAVEQETVSDEAREIVEAVAQQLSSHIENLRLSEQIEKRAAELQTVATLSGTTSTLLDPEKLLQTVVDLTKERFNLYHAHVYLTDESLNSLLLTAGAGEIGRQMVAEGWNIPIDHEHSIVANAARNRQSVIANNVVRDQDSSFLSNQLLPNTRSEMAIPMIVGENVLGVFDVQAEIVNYFSAEDVNIFTTLAAQIAIALQNARLYMEQAATVTQLRELDRLKSAFLANMSHELRTPLNSILGFTDVMLEGLDGSLTDYMDNDLRLIQKNGRHLLHLINDVLDMAKIESGRMNLHPETFKVHDIFEEVASITAPLASEKNLSLYIDENSDPQIEVYADNTRLRQVMINLVNNSIKFTDQGKIVLSVKPLDGARVLISVKDTGIGIPPDHLESVFQEFTQVDTTTTRKAGGTGLGLPISRRLIEMHGGRLWAESTGVDGEGSTFFVEMPVEAHIADVIEKQEK